MARKSTIFRETAVLHLVYTERVGSSNLSLPTSLGAVAPWLAGASLREDEAALTQRIDLDDVIRNGHHVRGRPRRCLPHVGDAALRMPVYSSFRNS
jgi:hypothetical protein